MTPVDVDRALTEHGYLPDEGLATAIFLALSLKRPLLLEGEAGVGKTEVAKVLAAWTHGELIRLQCYEGIDAAQAVYDWDYARQLLHLRAAEASGETAGRSADDLEADLYDERFLVKRALLRAIEHREGPPPVLLIDEIDRADDEFEAYLLEVLSDFQVTVPELGVFQASRPPIVILTSNRTRDVHDALKRRCLYHWVEHPGFEREVAIVRLRVPEVGQELARQVAAAVEVLRDMKLYKPPGVAETIDWATALGRLGVTRLDERSVVATLGTVLKYREDHQRVEQHGVADIVKQAFERGLLPGVNVSGATDNNVDTTTDAGEIAVAFTWLLRGAGLSVPMSSTIAFTEALVATGIADRDDTYWAGRATLVRRPEDHETYDRAFKVFWEGRQTVGVEVPAEEPLHITLAIDDDTADDSRDEPDSAEASDEETIELRFSTTEVLRHKDFADYSDQELVEAQQLMTRLRLVGSPRESRRLSGSKGRTARPDLRRTVRAAMKSNGEPFRRHWREPTTRNRRLVLLLDVSGSMEPYARALLRFVHAAVAGRQKVEAFALGTRLTRITRELSSRDPDIALRQTSTRVVDWSGGTRLGDGLRQFNDAWGQRGMARGAIVVILSDGWDRGDPAVLAEQMVRLHRVAHRVIWVNPLKVTPGYAPLARGMAAALPYVDAFVEGHSVAALEELARAISGDDTSSTVGQPARRTS